MTFDPKKLTQEERALWDAMAIQERRNRRVAGESYSETEGAFRDLLKARCALFGEPASAPTLKVCPNCGHPGEHAEHTNESGFKWTCQRQEPASAGRKVECPNCGELTSSTHEFEDGRYECQSYKPAQPEPAAFGKKLVSAETHPDLFPWVKPHAQMRDEAVAEATKAEPVAAEMVTSEANGYTLEWSPLDLPQEVREAAVSLRMAKLVAIRSGRHIDARNHSDAAEALESFWRTRTAQPAPAVAMTEELRRVIFAAHERWSFAFDDGRTYLAPEKRADVARAIEAVRAQAAEAGKVRMPKVRELIEASGKMADGLVAASAVENNGTVRIGLLTEARKFRAAADAALAELDAAEKRK